MTVRLPAAAGILYPGDAALLAGTIGDLANAADARARPSVKCLLVPHTGLVWAGPLSAAAYAHVHPRVTRVVVLTPAREDDAEGIVLSSAEGFATPLGVVDTLSTMGLLGLPGVRVDDQAHARETGIETQLPFLIDRLFTFEVLPVVVGRVDVDDLVGFMDAVWGGRETLVVVAGNLTPRAHIHAEMRDELGLERLLAGRSGFVVDDGASWLLLEALAAQVDRRGLRGTVVAQGEIAGVSTTPGGPVGGAAVVFTEEK